MSKINASEIFYSEITPAAVPVSELRLEYVTTLLHERSVLMGRIAPDFEMSLYFDLDTCNVW